MAAIVKNQLSRDAALRLFDYREGMLFWRHQASGRRSDLRAVSYSTRRGYKRAEVRIGGVVFEAKYLVWNWHYGLTERMLDHQDRDRSNFSIGNLIEVEGAANFICAPSAPAVPTTAHSVSCPCCSQPVSAPSLDVLVMHFGISPFQERILDCLWKARGRPVSKGRILDAMYADDPDGGPSNEKATAAMKEAIFRMRDKLDGSGVSVEYDNFHKGYRLTINLAKPMERQEAMRMAS